ncbi:purine permease 21-like [Olea europaea var. sylvestris]|uniref:purine permease 21-like n=1 Tax=Olea europaea var. sylvestris TaxID=158386 RepID=UPI000C1D1B09|nr:purine permease 21-like [Olea europaea var. sylvestris]
MGEAPELPSSITGGADEKAEQVISPENINQNPQNPSFHCLKQYKWWIQMAIFTLFVLAGQSVGILLGRLYYNNGGNSNWMATFVQCAGFPMVLPFLCTPKSKISNPEIKRKNHSTLILALVYISLGIFLAADCMLYTIGLKYLPVTTYTLIGASQLGFNALFSYFLNGQKFTPSILNSLVLLTISSTLLVFQNDSDDSKKASRAKYVLGFVCTIAASAGYALMLSLTQLAFQKIIKRETMRAIIDMSLYQNIVATFAILIGLFASGDWKKLNAEMGNFKPGKVAYVMNLVGTAVSWQAFTVGCTGLIFKVSSLFSNVISMLGLPIAPVLAVIFLHEKMTGLNGVAMVLAMWGFVSYMYQHYLDDLKTKAEKKHSNDVSEVPLTETS